MSLPPLLTLQNIHLRFGSDSVLDGADLVIVPGKNICLVGRNGSGKSTLAKVATGLIDFDEGERFIKPGTVIHYLPQETNFDGLSSILDYSRSLVRNKDSHHLVDSFLSKLRIDTSKKLDELSGGQAKCVSLVRVLATEPDILFLDEPTNHLDLPTIQWFENELVRSNITLVVISHDRRFMETMSDVTIWLDRGKVRRLEKSFHYFESWRDEIFENEDRLFKKIDKKIASEEIWLRQGVTARRKRNIRRLTSLKKLRKERIETKKRSANVTFSLNVDDSKSKAVIEARSISKSFGDNKVVENFSIRIRRGDCIGIIGRNGIGKTTLLNLLTGYCKPDSGKVQLGKFLEIASMDQNRELLNPKLSLKNVLTGEGGDFLDFHGKSRHVIGYMKDFLFTPEMADMPVNALSGGERARVMLARALAIKSNLLVLDEPTNDLDLETLDLLQEMIQNYKGTVILVSHDRDFLDRVSTSIVFSAGCGVWQEYIGGYSDVNIKQTKESDNETGPNVIKSLTVKNKKLSDRIKVKENTHTKKLSYKDEYALEKLTKKIIELNSKSSVFEKELADTGLYKRDAVHFLSVTRKLEEIKNELVDAENEWLRLEMLREKIKE